MATIKTLDTLADWSDGITIASDWGVDSAAYANTTVSTKSYIDNCITSIGNMAVSNSIAWHAGECYNKDYEKGKDIKNNMKFGKYTRSDMSLCPCGPVFKDEKGTWKHFDIEVGLMVPEKEWVFDDNDTFFTYPVTPTEIRTGDVVLGIDNAPYVVLTAQDDEHVGFSVMNPYTGECMTLTPTVNAYGFKYVTRILNTMEMVFGFSKPDEKSPFGNVFGALATVKALPDLALYNMLVSNAPKDEEGNTIPLNYDTVVATMTAMNKK